MIPVHERNVDAPDFMAITLASFLGRMPEASREPLLEGSRVIKAQAGELVFRSEDAPRRGALVVTGLLRVFLEAPDGRRAVVRYAGTGGSIGIVSALFGGIRAHVQAVVDSSILELDMTRLLRAVQTDSAVGYVIAEEVSRRLTDSLIKLAATSFGSIRYRVVRHLLDLVTEHHEGLPYVSVTQAQLAADVGSVREVVARSLRELRTAELIETRRAGIVLRDVPGLIALLSEPENRD